MAVKIEIFKAPECGGCASAAKMLADVASALGSGQFDVQVIDVIEEIDYAAAMGVLSTPSIAINERLVFSSIPTRRVLQRELEKHLRRNDGQERFSDA